LLDRRHGFDQPAALSLVQWLQQRPRQLIAEPVQAAALGTSGPGEQRDPYPVIRR
jgi:hypothetical protein